MKNKLKEEIHDAENDLLDHQAALAQAEEDINSAIRWRDKMKRWVADDEARLNDLLKDSVYDNYKP